MSVEAMSWARRVAATGALNTGEAFVLLLLADHADEQWSCFPSQERLARDSAQTVRSVERHIKKLRELELVSSESMYGQGRGRIGMRYKLHEERLAALIEPVENRMITRPDNLSGKSENRMITRPDNLSGKSENRMITRPDNLSGESTHPTMTTDSPDNHDIRPYKDRARTNHQEPSVSLSSVRQSGAVRANELDGQTDGQTTGQESEGAPVEVSASPSTAPEHSEGVREHRGVDLDLLCERVPAAAGLDEGQLRLIVQVVLARASGPVRNPVAFVAKSLASEFHELVAITAEHVKPSVPASAGGQVHQFPAREPVPCTNPDHAAYGAAVLQDCPHCRVEAKVAPVTRQARG